MLIEIDHHLAIGVVYSIIFWSAGQSVSTLCCMPVKVTDRTLADRVKPLRHSMIYVDLQGHGS